MPRARKQQVMQHNFTQNNAAPKSAPTQRQQPKRNTQPILRDVQDIIRAEKQAVNAAVDLTTRAVSGVKSAANKVARSVGLAETSRAGMTIRTGTDGISSGSIIVNNSSVVEKFKTRVEKIQDFKGSTAFSCATFEISPVNSTLFPIFSHIAQSYAKWRPIKLDFIYRTMCYSASGSAVSAGELVLATNPDPNAAPYTDTTSAQNNVGAESFAPFLNVRYNALKGVDKNVWRWCNDSDGTEPRTTLAGLINLISTGNVNGTSILGSLFVEYAFEMADPIQPASLSDLSYFRMSSTISPTLTGGTLDSNNTAGLQGFTYSPTTGYVTFPAASVGNGYTVVCNCYQNDSDTITMATIGTYTTAHIYQNSTQGVAYSINAFQSTLQQAIVPATSGLRIQFTCSGAPFYSEIIITQIGVPTLSRVRLTQEQKLERMVLSILSKDEALVPIIHHYDKFLNQTIPSAPLIKSPSSEPTPVEAKDDEDSNIPVLWPHELAELTNDELLLRQELLRRRKAAQQLANQTSD